MGLSGASSGCVWRVWRDVLWLCVSWSFVTDGCVAEEADDGEVFDVVCSAVVPWRDVVDACTVWSTSVVVVEWD